MVFRSLGAALLSLAVSLPAVAAAPLVEDRSPFTQGQWWDPTRAGNGFELFNVGNQGMATWFTFDDARNPVWYTAQGELGTTWTLQKHYWAGLRHGAVTAVGTIRINFLNDAQAEADFTLMGRTGTWRIEPFMTSAKSNEIDHSGSYYDPANPGWGFTLTEQGEVLGGVLYTYTDQGFPTWVAGFSRGGLGTVGVVSVRGPCPGCPPDFMERFDAGRIDIDLVNERQAVLHPALTIAIAPGQDIDARPLSQLGRPALDRPADRVLARFGAGETLKRHLAAAMPNMAFGSTPVSGPTPVPDRPVVLQAGAASACDLVQASARHVYTFGHDGVDRRMARIQVAVVEGDGAALEARDPVPLASGFNTKMEAAMLCADAGVLASVTGTQPYVGGDGSQGSANGFMRGRTYVEVFGLADPAKPASRWWAEIEGHVHTSFRIGDRLYLVLRYAPFVQGLDYRYLPEMLEANRQVLDAAPLSALTPYVRVNGGESTPLLSQGAVYLSQQGSQRRADFAVLVAIDLREPRIVDTLAIVAPVDRLGVAGNDVLLFSSFTRQSARTEIHHVHLGTPSMAIAGTAILEGGMLASDVGTDGRLRTLSTFDPGSGLPSTRLSVFEPGIQAEGITRTVAAVPIPSDPGYVMTAALFAGNRAYLANSAGSSGQLFVGDLSNALDPKVAAAGVVPGRAEFLRVLPDGSLLLVGHDASFFGFRGDLYLNAYDVRGALALLQHVVLGPSNSDTPLMAEPAAFAAQTLSDGAVGFAFPAQVSAGSGLLHFELRDARSFNRGVVRLADLITFRAAAAPRGAVDPTFAGARALLYPAGTVYVGNGQFWLQDNAGNVNGPY